MHKQKIGPLINVYYNTNYTIYPSYNKEAVNIHIYYNETISEYINVKKACPHTHSSRLKSRFKSVSSRLHYDSKRASHSASAHS